MSIAAFCSSLEFAHHSTMQNVDGLNFCVRNGYRCFPAALTAILAYDCQRRARCNAHTHMPYRAYVDCCRHNVPRIKIRGIINTIWISPECSRTNLAWTLVVDGLNTSSPWCLHPDSIKLVFYESPERSLFRCGFKLRCFQL